MDFPWTMVNYWFPFFNKSGQKSFFTDDNIQFGLDIVRL